MIIIYIVCKDLVEANKIGNYLVINKLVACVNLIPNMKSIYIYPENSNQIENSDEIILLAKTIQEKYKQIEKEIIKIHSYETPCIFSVKIENVLNQYKNWVHKTLK